MADALRFDLVSPERLLLSRDVEMVVLPGSEGDFGVTVSHAPMVATLRPGTVAVYEGGKVAERIFVSGGFVEVTPTACVLLADDAAAFSDLDGAVIAGQIKDAQEDLADAKTDLARRAAEQRLKIAEAKQAALAAPAYS